MKLFYRLLFSILLLCFGGCRSDRSKAEHDTTVAVCNKKLFVEMFTIFGSGAFGGDRVSEYLTDSINFRIYIGTFDNAHEAYSFECFGDSIKVSKRVDDSNENRKVESVRFYSYSQLKASKQFD
jgi:hypothetical protein